MSGGRSAQRTHTGGRRRAVGIVLLAIVGWAASSSVLPAGAATRRAGTSTSTSVATRTSAAGAPTTAALATTAAGARTSTTVKPRPTSSTIAAKDVKTDVEHKIIDAQTEAAPDLKIGKATCPKALAVPKTKIPAGTFTCTIVIEGVLAPYEVVLTA